jgi:outer membrane PBP1 activator LpoA protein
LAVTHHFSTAIAGGYVLTPYDFKHLTDKGLTHSDYWLKQSQKAAKHRDIVAQIQNFHILMAVELMKHPKTAPDGKKFIASLHQQLNSGQRRRPKPINASAWASQQAQVAALLHPKTPPAT